MKLKPELRAQVDDKGRLVLPPEIVSRYGLKPGSQIPIDEMANGLSLRTPHLKKIYIEPTNRCNLECRTCIRNVWDEPLGKMSEEVFDRVIEDLHTFSPPPTVSFGGFGEPLFHPNIIGMVTQAKSLGASVELITNGTLLKADLSRELITAGLDRLWISLDGATPESYADVRLGAELPQVVENITRFRNAIYAEIADIGCCDFAPISNTQLGIVFVAMKRNIADLPEVIRLGHRLGAKRFIVTNVLPYTKEMYKEVLYQNAFSYLRSPSLSLPVGMNGFTRETLYQVMHSDTHVIPPVSNLQGSNDRCPFIESGAGVIGWDGSFSPCLPLLHSHTSYIFEFERFSRRWAIGNIAEHSLFDLWNAPEHLAFRERVQTFDFPSCVDCLSCELLENNEEDCYGNDFPTCGGCLWAQGIIQCP